MARVSVGIAPFRHAGIEFGQERLERMVRMPGRETKRRWTGWLAVAGLGIAIGLGACAKPPPAAPVAVDDGEPPPPPATPVVPVQSQPLGAPGG